MTAMPAPWKRSAVRLHVTRERVRQIELRALKKLRHIGPSELIRQ